MKMERKKRALKRRTNSEKNQVSVRSGIKLKFIQTISEKEKRLKKCEALQFEARGFFRYLNWLENIGKS